MKKWYLLIALALLGSACSGSAAVEGRMGEGGTAGAPELGPGAGGEGGDRGDEAGGGSGGTAIELPATLTIRTPPIEAYVDRDPALDIFPPGQIRAGIGGDETTAYWKVRLIELFSPGEYVPLGEPDRIEMCGGLIVEDRVVVGVDGSCREFDDSSYWVEDEVEGITVPITSTELVFGVTGPENTLWYTEVRLYWAR